MRTLVDLSTGDVIDVETNTKVDPSIDAEVLEAAKLAKFDAVLPEFKGLTGSGILVYRSSDLNRPDRVNRKPKVFIINKKQSLNDLAIERPKPNVEGIPMERVSGIVEVSILVEPLRGTVLAAKAVTGPEHLREISEKAALEARFRHAFIDGGGPVYVKGRLVYRFGK